jgi:carbon-monoxide dehydrogenase small subunit
MKVTLRVNGETVEAENVWPGASLLTMLRDELQLPGSKNACEQGECGSCSVLMDGDLVCACLVMAGQAEGRDVRTVEGLSGDGESGVGDVQQAFLDAGGVQCGFCTPGFIMAVDHLLAEHPEPSDETMREALSGNLCRCTGYEKIFDAVRLAATRRREGTAVATTGGAAR